MIETKTGKKIHTEFEQGYMKALNDVMNLPQHYYKTYISGFVEEEQAVFISDIRQLKEQK